MSSPNTPLKVGDKVRCIEEPNHGDWKLFLHRSYWITSVDFEGKIVRIKGHDTDEHANWSVQRFEKVSANPRKR